MARSIPSRSAGLIPLERNTENSAAALQRANLLGRAPIIIGFLEPSIVFQTRTDARLMPINEEAFIALQTAPPGTPVLMDCDVAAFAQLREWSFRAIGPDIHGLNYANGDHVCLRPGVTGEMSNEERARFLDSAAKGAPERRLNAPVPQ